MTRSFFASLLLACLSSKPLLVEARLHKELATTPIFHFTKIKALNSSYFLGKFGYAGKNGFVGVALRLVNGMNNTWWGAQDCDLTKLPEVIRMKFDVFDDHKGFKDAMYNGSCSDDVNTTERPFFKKPILTEYIEVTGKEIGKWTPWVNKTLDLPNNEGKSQILFFSIYDCDKVLSQTCKLDYISHRHQGDGDEVGTDHPSVPGAHMYTCIGAVITFIMILGRRGLYASYDSTPWALKMLALGVFFRLLESFFDIFCLFQYAQHGEPTVIGWLGEGLCTICGDLTMAVLMFSLAWGYTLVDPEGAADEHWAPVIFTCIHACPPSCILVWLPCMLFLYRGEPEWSFHEWEGTYGWACFVCDLIYNIIFSIICLTSYAVAKGKAARRFLLMLWIFGSLSVGSWWMSFVWMKMHPLDVQYEKFQYFERGIHAISQVLLARIILSPSTYLKICYLAFPNLPSGNSGMSTKSNSTPEIKNSEAETPEDEVAAMYGMHGFKTE